MRSAWRSCFAVYFVFSPLGMIQLSFLGFLQGDDVREMEIDSRSLQLLAPYRTCGEMTCGRCAAFRLQKKCHERLFAAMNVQARGAANFRLRPLSRILRTEIARRLYNS